MKKKVLSLMLASALALGTFGGLAACDTEPEVKEVTGITIDSLVETNVESVTLSPDDHFGLRVSFTPDGSESDVTWTSSDTKIATVSGGYVTAVTPGEVTITATTANGKTDTCKVVVGDWIRYTMAGSMNGWADAEAYYFVQDGTDLHKWTLTVDLTATGTDGNATEFKFKKIGSWDDSIGVDKTKAKKSVTAAGTDFDLGSENITVTDAGNYTFTLKMKVGGGVESLTYKRNGDITPAA